SIELNEQALRVMPGPHANVRIRLADRPLFFVKARGARVWDVDGKEYVEFWNGGGPDILGYGNEDYHQAVKAQLDALCHTFAEAHIPDEIELCEKIVKYVPCAEKVRFCVTGTEAVQLMIRLARAYTGRPSFIRFQGHYHGWLDNILGGRPHEDPQARPVPIPFQEDWVYTEGRARHALEDSFLLPWNDIEAVERTLARYGEEVAIIFMEPYLCNGGCCAPKPGYLERVRQLCDQYGIVLGFDEVITGFRVGLGGAQEALGITPDIATFGKALAGGMPIGAVAGKASIMDLLAQRRVIGAGTFNGHPMTIAAALATLRILERNHGAVYKRIERLQERLGKGLKELGRRKGLPTLIQGPRGALYHNFADLDCAHDVMHLRQSADWERHSKFYTRLIDEGVLMLPDGRWYISAAVTDADIDRALECAERAMSDL
ncbi:MAG: aminotransferase class III-fold pyridoxal phosphate-dependent enzyme, partial [Elusimicrobia bacterium]|nr:aminotransferase class III-fold pyridoxal phosphate-dependent enzyme [Elusimicrobiota bacterium]